MIALLTAAWLAFAAPIGEVPTQSKPPDLPAVDREIVVEIEIPPNRAPLTRILPGRVTLQIDAPIDHDAALEVLETVPEPLVTRADEIESGTRIRITHPERKLQAVASRRGRLYRLVFGADSEQTRLRRFAEQVQRPMPVPRNIGAYLELWQEAEAATAAGNLKQARRLWEKIQEAPDFDDLAALRIAELYIISGHVNEALSRLRAVSRRFPRSAGASLGRVDLLHLQAITGLGSPTLEQVELAVSTVDRRRFDPFARLRASLLLRDLGLTPLGVAWFPDLAVLPKGWREPGAAELDDLLEHAVAIPVRRGDAMGTVVQHRAWKDKLEHHPHRPEIEDAVVEAYGHLGMFGAVIPMLRSRLRDLPNAIDEAIMVDTLATAFNFEGDVEHSGEVVAFQVKNHPKAPRVAQHARTLALREHHRDGLPAARKRLANLRDMTRDRDLIRALLATEADLVQAYGTPQQRAQVLSMLQRAGFDDESTREPALAVALSRSGRFGDAQPLLRKWIGQTTDAETRDRMAYQLAVVEFGLGNEADGVQILELLAKNGTQWGGIARARLRERTLGAVVEQLEAQLGNKDEPAKDSTLASGAP